MGERKLRVVVADDSLLIRQGVVALFSIIDDVEVVAECDDLPTLLDAVAEHRPDVVLTDVCMPPTLTDEGIQAAATIRADHPGTGVLVLSQYAEAENVLALFDNGSEGVGYLLKERVSDPDELGRAIRSVGAGGSVVDPQIVEVLLSARGGGTSAVDRLTPRERDVMGLIAEGYNNASIGERLVLSERAVAKHINSIFSKLDLGEDDEVHKRVRAVLTWLAH
ncbi:response regulator transcription factor [Ilumatobacter coccineus]|uniref:Putative NarL family two-component response regulator n=1 Tax=Ilumatobacter coccineus (strain NBRC 103263 / KCTC 29153 / YM16-304) TaxID=1313172 RepID=A0A6C7E1N7_ILUCY|nr:response regulator transcription factor [Ilumatobacter coccineus]BAN02064.1 putative NarL family two-component response regulator [Ilumatobacter coccineus YM16-304]